MPPDTSVVAHGLNDSLHSSGAAAAASQDQLRLAALLLLAAAAYQASLALLRPQQHGGKAACGTGTRLLDLGAQLARAVTQCLRGLAGAAPPPPPPPRRSLRDEGDWGNDEGAAAHGRQAFGRGAKMPSFAEWNAQAGGAQEQGQPAEAPPRRRAPPTSRAAQPLSYWSHQADGGGASGRDSPRVARGAQQRGVGGSGSAGDAPAGAFRFGEPGRRRQQQQHAAAAALGGDNSRSAAAPRMPVAGGGVGQRSTGAAPLAADAVGVGWDPDLLQR